MMHQETKKWNNAGYLVRRWFDSKEKGGRNEQHLHLRGSLYGGFPAVRAETEAAENVTENRKQTVNDEIKKGD